MEEPFYAAKELVLWRDASLPEFPAWMKFLMAD